MIQVFPPKTQVLINAEIISAEINAEGDITYKIKVTDAYEYGGYEYTPLYVPGKNVEVKK